MRRKKRNKLQKIDLRTKIILLASVGIFIIFGIIAVVSHIHEKNKTIQVMQYDVLDYNAIAVDIPLIQEAYLTPNKNSRSQKKIKKVKGIVIHYTANPGTDAMANRNYFESMKEKPDQSAYKVSSNFIIGLDGTILACIPENEVAYASNNRNKDTLSIECCHPDASGKFSTETYQSLVHLIAYLCDKYELMQNSIIRHYDVTGKNCPKYYVENTDAWNQLKAAVLDYLRKSDIENKEE